jgi:AraC-like DNA-binding protein
MEVQATSQLSVAETLREKIQEYLNRHPNITLQTLATRSNVPVTSLRRLMNEESKSEVAPHSVLNICSYVYKEKNISTLLKKIPENLSSYIEKHFGQFIFGGTEIKYSCDLNILLQDRQSYFIYKLAANHNGTDYIEITELFGSIGKKKVDELIQLGAIIKDSSDRLHAKDKNFSLDLNVATSFT